MAGCCTLRDCCRRRHGRKAKGFDRVCASVSTTAHKKAALIGVSVGSLAVGAAAVGALAIGAIAIGKMRVRKLKVDELTVERLTVKKIKGV